MTIIVNMQPQESRDDPARLDRREASDSVVADALRLSPGYLLARLGGESRGLWARMLAERDLTPHHFGVLTALQHLGEAHQHRLATMIGVDARNAVGVIDGLSQRGLLERQPDPRDRRKHRISLTTQGKATVAELQDAGTAIEDEMFRGLTATDRDALHRLLLKLFDARISQ